MPSTPNGIQRSVLVDHIEEHFCKFHGTGRVSCLYLMQENTIPKNKPHSGQTGNIEDDLYFTTMHGFKSPGAAVLAAFCLYQTEQPCSFEWLK